MSDKKPKFMLGRTLATPGALEALTPSDIHNGMSRHSCGDWGDLCLEDIQANEEALQNGDRLLSAYHGQNETKFWIITEADRSATTVLLPSEY